MARGVFALLYVVVVVAGVGLNRLAVRAGQMAEYRADLEAVRVGGKAAAALMLRTLLLDGRIGQALQTAVNRGDVDVWQAQRAAVADVAPRELDRAERVARRTLQRIDASHPPTHLRLDLLRAQPDTPALVTFDRATMDRVDAELRATLPRTLGS